MSESARVPVWDRIIGMLVCVVGLGLVVAAATVAAPVALAQGFFTLRALLFFSILVGASALAGQAVAGVAQRLRRR